MALPKKLKNFDLFQDGVSWLGQIPSVTLPKLTRKMEKYRAGGMGGSVSIDFGQDDMEASFTAGGMLYSALVAYGATTHDAVMLRFAGAYQAEDTGSYDSVEVVMRGRYSEIDFGDGKTDTDTEHKFTFPLSYYKLRVNGVDLIEIDTVANIFNVNGMDIAAAQRNAIGHW